MSEIIRNFRKLSIAILTSSAIVILVSYGLTIKNFDVITYLGNLCRKNKPQKFVCPGSSIKNPGKDKACEGCPGQEECLSAINDNKKNSVSQTIKEKLKYVENIILILSGKGGVGKSTVSAQLSFELQKKGYTVGLLDVDICGPSIPKMTNTSDLIVRPYSGGWEPVYCTEKMSVMSVGYLLNSADDAIVWRGMRKNGLIRQFLTDVHWGKLDFLVIDTPPGTSDEHLSLIAYLKDSNVTGGIIVTTPQEIALSDVRKEINFCKTAEIPIIGVVKNMNNSILSSVNPKGVEKMCEIMSVDLLCSFDMSEDVLWAAEKGEPLNEDSETSKRFDQLINRILPHCFKKKTN